MSTAMHRTNQSFIVPERSRTARPLQRVPSREEQAASEEVARLFEIARKAEEAEQRQLAEEARKKAARDRELRAEAIWARRLKYSFIDAYVSVAEAVRSARSRRANAKRKLALLLPAHNEELIIETTIKSALAAGQPLEDIFVVNDNSSDDTQKIAVRLLGKKNVLKVGRSGKALAVKKATDHFKIVDRYEWLHVADADSIFGKDYFRYYTKKLNGKKYAVAVGFVQSLRGNWISTYRALSYTYSQHVSRRIQAKLGMISVFPGPITSFRTDILDKLDFSGATITEDFDVTLQVHRYKLGAILYIPQAVNFTQDPQTLRDFWRQNMRWQRGFFQCVRKYKIGFRFQRIDLSLGFQMLQTMLFFVQLLLVVPFIMLVTHNWLVLPVMITADIVLNGVIAVLSSFVIKRWNLLGALPYFYFLRWVELAAYVVSFVEIIILKKFSDGAIGWSVAGRRYKVSAAAMTETAV